MSVATGPIIIAGDTGRRTEQFADHVCSMEKTGSAAIIIEDKTDQKKNALLGTKPVYASFCTVDLCP